MNPGVYGPLDLAANLYTGLPINRLSRLKYHFVGDGLKTIFALGRFWPARKIVLCVYANPKEMYCCNEHQLYMFILEILFILKKY